MPLGLGFLARHKAKLTGAGLVLLALAGLGVSFLPSWAGMVAWGLVLAGSLAYLVAR